MSGKDKFIFLILALLLGGAVFLKLESDKINIRMEYFFVIKSCFLTKILNKIIAQIIKQIFVIAFKGSAQYSFSILSQYCIGIVFTSFFIYLYYPL